MLKFVTEEKFVTFDSGKNFFYKINLLYGGYELFIVPAGQVGYFGNMAEKELAKHCASLSKAGTEFTSVVELRNDGTTPRVAVKGMKEYKENL